MSETTHTPDPDAKPKSKLRLWLERMGIGAFLFFFIKGLVWLAIFFGAFKFIGCEGDTVPADGEPTEIAE